LKYLFDSKIRNEIESENIRVYSVVFDGPFKIQAEEVAEVRFWTFEELIQEQEHGSSFTPNFIKEFEKLRKTAVDEK
jgi:isopentenyldiphosphate isomerase